MRLEKRDEEKVMVRAGTQRRPGGKGQGKGSPECYRCGRLGHRRAQCTWSTHLDGGKPRPAPPPRQAGNMEEDSKFPVPPVIEAATIEINAFDDDSGDVGSDLE